MAASQVAAIQAEPVCGALFSRRSPGLCPHCREGAAEFLGFRKCPWVCAAGNWVVPAWGEGPHGVIIP